jgi:peptidoglycan/xylan/chitin deacetylase (PgdA/CDA1 family)
MNMYDLKERLNSFLVSSRLSKLAKPFSPYMGEILMFHRVVAPDENVRIPENQMYEITPDILCAVIEFYRQLNFDFISLDDMLDRLNAKKSDHRFVTFTFDDGYTDTFTTVYPLLKEENIPFCVYITTDYPDRKAIFWWDILEEVLHQNKSLTFMLDDKLHTIPCESLPDKREAFLNICRLVLKSSDGMTAAWRAIFDTFGVDYSSPTERLAISWDQIIKLSQDPLVTIGAHTCSHPPLAGLPEEEARDEIFRSRDILQGKTGLRIDHFSYPYGSRLDVTNREARLAASLGFRSAVTTETGNISKSHQSKLMLLPRLNVNRDTYLRDLTLATDGCIPQS